MHVWWVRWTPQLVVRSTPDGFRHVAARDAGRNYTSRILIIACRVPNGIIRIIIIRSTNYQYFAYICTAVPGIPGGLFFVLLKTSNRTWNRRKKCEKIFVLTSSCVTPVEALDRPCTYPKSSRMTPKIHGTTTTHAPRE